MSSPQRRRRRIVTPADFDENFRKIAEDKAVPTEHTEGTVKALNKLRKPPAPAIPGIPRKENRPRAKLAP